MTVANCQASCECGELQVTCAEAPVVEMVCHCADCRDATGRDYSVTAFFRSSAVRIEGRTRSSTYVSAAGNSTTREACVKCDAMMLDKSSGFTKLTGVFANRILAPFAPEPSLHMWTRSRVEGVEVWPGLPEFAESPG